MSPINLEGFPSEVINSNSVALVIPTYKSFLSLDSITSSSSNSFAMEFNGIILPFKPIIITTLNSRPLIECIVTSFIESLLKSNSSFDSNIVEGMFALSRYLRISVNWSFFLAIIAISFNSYSFNSSLLMVFVIKSASSFLFLNILHTGYTPCLSIRDGFTKLSSSIISSSPSIKL